MHKLTIISGPHAGTSYSIQEGETSIGRQAGNVILLHSSKVSKRHCVLVSNGQEIYVEDQGSSNGTFVNGELAKRRQVKNGDRLSVGNYIFELNQPSKSKKLARIGGVGDVLEFPSPIDHSVRQSSEPMSDADHVARERPPEDLKEKLIWALEKYVMPFFYSLNTRHDWKHLWVWMISIFTIVTLAIAIAPLLQLNEQTAIREQGRRARFMAKQIVDQNAAFIAAGAKTKTTIGDIGKEPGVQLAVLVDLENRVIAPSQKLNQYLTTGKVATFSKKASQAYLAGREKGKVKRISESLIVAVEPLKIFDQRLSKNRTVAMAIVSMDTSLATPDLGSIGVMYSRTLVVIGVFAIFLFYILYRMTLKPLEVLNRDVDQALKGEISQISRKYQFEDLSALWDVVESAVQRVPKGTQSGTGAFGDSSIEDGSGNQPSADFNDVIAPIQMIGKISQLGVAICDSSKNIVYMNSVFEEMTGIRSEESYGQPFEAVARDEALVALTDDLFEQVQNSGKSMEEDFDFSGIYYKVQAVSLGGESQMGFAIFVRKEEDF